MDDQPLAGGVLPAQLRNAAPGNANALAITQSPANSPQFYSSAQGIIQNSNTSVLTSATHSVAAAQGWMYGDPQSSPASFQTSNPVTSNPGSAAWQSAGQAGIIGSSGWFLNVSDPNFPPLAGGVSVEGWFNYPFYGSATLAGTDSAALQQPACPLTLFELATATAPVAVLQLDTSGHLNLITYNGSAGTSNSIYTGSDLRSSSPHQVVVELTTTTWTVYVDGGITAKVSGTAAGMTSGWSWLIVNGDLGSGGGSSIGNAAGLVQSASAVTATGGSTTLTVSLPAVTTAGNCLVVCVTTAGGTGATVTGITLGGSADHFAVAKATQNGTSVDCEIWTDPNCAGGQSTVVITLSGSADCTAEVMEFTGIPASPVDKTAGSTGTSATFTSGATAALAQSAEIAIGVAAATSSGGTGLNVTGPPSWGNFTQLSSSGGGGSHVYSLISYLGVSSTAAQTYQGTVSSASQPWAAAIATIKTNGGLVHSGNVQVSHLAVYPSQLPAWRVLAHYWAAITAFGQLPAPANLNVAWNGNTALPPDGSAGGGTYSGGQGILASAVVTAVAGTVNSGPSAWATAPTFINPGTLWVGWTGLAPSFGVYTATAVGAEKQAAVSAGSGDSFAYGTGAAGIGGGVSQISDPVLVQSIQVQS
ncbi:MAG TPA: hypothetical protein VGS06_05000, partial [Streptosporangiaceae bacterium]|nr:hypothetical protein [Streptosporangiaceae bacterium]